MEIYSGLKHGAKRSGRTSSEEKPPDFDEREKRKEHRRSACPGEHVARNPEEAGMPELPPASSAHGSAV